MKKIRLITIFFAVLMVVNGFNFVTYAWDYPLDIDVVYISFNYNTGSYSEDALSIIPGYGGSVIQREWDNGGSTNLNFAYIKSQTNRKIQVQFWHNQDQSQSYNFAIGAAVAQGTSFGDVPYATVSFPSYNNGYSEIKTYQLNGTVPGSVGKRYVKFAWWCVNEALSMGYTGNHYYYTLLDAPQAPMAIPWVTVLDYACVWANGGSTISNTLEYLTNELYACGSEYDGGTHYTSGSNTNLNLTSLLADLQNPSSVQMDCRDYSNFLQVLSNALGGSCEYKRIQRPSSPYYFLYNYLYPSGWTSVASPNYWNYHQVGWENSQIADGSTKLDFDNDPTSSPFTWTLAIGNVSLSVYIDKLTETAGVSDVATGTCTVY